MSLVPTGYRKNVAIVVLNSEGRILVCQRADVAMGWQLPQGGVDEGESLEQAAFRELEEEIGTKDVQIIGQYPGYIRYQWPTRLVFERGYKGQEQYYFLARLASKAVIDFSKHHTVEFQNSEWLTAREFIERGSGFKSEAYRQAIEKLIEIYPGIILEK